LLLVQGMGFGPQGQGDFWRCLQPEGPALSLQQCECPKPPQWVHIDGKGGPCARGRIKAPRTLMEKSWWGWEEARSMRGTRLANTLDFGHYSHSLPDSSKEHELKPSHTPRTRHCRVPGEGTLGYFSFIHRSMIFTYIFFYL
jgi:hypothetical protein